MLLSGVLEIDQGCYYTTLGPRTCTKLYVHFILTCTPSLVVPLSLSRCDACTTSAERSNSDLKFNGEAATTECPQSNDGPITGWQDPLHTSKVGQGSKDASKSSNFLPGEVGVEFLWTA